MTLNEYIRDVALLKGTKVMCREGGCGCCVVGVTRKDLTTGGNRTLAINSVSTNVQESLLSTFPFKRCLHVDLEPTPV